MDLEGMNSRESKREERYQSTIERRRERGGRTMNES